MTGHGKIGVVTGGGSGLGRAAALALLDQGWSLALAGRREEALEETVELSGAGPDRVISVPTDISSPTAVAALFGTVRSHFGRLDLLFNNAGAAVPRRPVTEVPFEDWSRVMDTTVTGTFLCAQEAFRVMRDQTPQGGRIINNGAPSAHSPRPNAIAYTTAKHAVLGLTRALSLDGRPYTISCGQIDVGNVAPVDGSPQPPAMQADGTMAVEATVPVARFTEALLLMASMPLDTNVQFLTVLPTTMPYIGRG
ncbi:SDR family oxidoreductase [Streptomyces sp. NPDC090052]|uniref:SDR family oxidoreductase n=1 Tax=unclassified Streptomyces TaxID=2593676 RepID=UPI002255989C|nr:SDR family oxidoreductase [Streptomyces sp. NBC_01306]MCX4725372.1 SDR family oxidoreductase [Streptomyces sp. NBC_01306]WSV05230.1 SDR family oxidoreductase [Streptomyces sp. NBC_01020]WSX68697.1 SDR family oxidoreductase [Streptomyces sp. NBC_00932]